MRTETTAVTTPEGMPPIVGNARSGFHVRGEAGVQYLLGDDAVESIDGHLRELVRSDGASHPDVDHLLDARSALTLATRLAPQHATSAAR